jgi:hypothetical protein
MGSFALALAVAALAVAAAAFFSGGLLDVLVGAPALGAKLDAHIEAVRRCHLGKEEVIAELAAGRLALAEAADRFARLEARRDEVRGEGPRLTRSEMYGQVIQWARARMPAEALARLEQERARLEASDRPKGP